MHIIARFVAKQQARSILRVCVRILELEGDISRVACMPRAGYFQEVPHFQEAVTRVVGGLPLEGLALAVAYSPACKETVNIARTVTIYNGYAAAALAALAHPFTAAYPMRTGTKT